MTELIPNGVRYFIPGNYPFTIQQLNGYIGGSRQLYNRHRSLVDIIRRIAAFIAYAIAHGVHLIGAAFGFCGKEIAGALAALPFRGRAVAEHIALGIGHSIPADHPAAIRLGDTRDGGLIQLHGRGSGGCRESSRYRCGRAIAADGAAGIGAAVHLEEAGGQAGEGVVGLRRQADRSRVDNTRIKLAIHQCRAPGYGAGILVIGGDGSHSRFALDRSLHSVDIRQIHLGGVNRQGHFLAGFPLFVADLHSESLGAAFSGRTGNHAALAQGQTCGQRTADDAPCHCAAAGGSQLHGIGSLIAALCQRFGGDGRGSYILYRRSSHILGAGEGILAIHPQGDGLAHIGNGNRIGGFIAALHAANRPYIGNGGSRRRQLGTKHIAHIGSGGVQFQAVHRAGFHNSSGRGAVRSALIAACAGYLQADGAAHIGIRYQIGSSGALDALGAVLGLHQPFIGNRGRGRRHALHRQHIAHHRAQVVDGNAVDIVLVIVNEEFIHHVTAAAAHLNVIPHRALGDDLHLSAYAVHANFAVLLAGAGAQTHAVAIAGPDGGIAHIGDGTGATAIAIDRQELAHHIAGVTADGDLAPVVAAFQNGSRRAHRELADHTVVGAGALTQAHTIAIMADDGGIADSSAGRISAGSQIITVHIAGVAITEAHLVPYTGGSQNLHHRTGIVTGQSLCIKRRGTAQTQPASLDGGILGCHRADGQKHQHKHQRHHCR